MDEAQREDLLDTVARLRREVLLAHRENAELRRQSPDARRAR